MLCEETKNIGKPAIRLADACAAWRYSHTYKLFYHVGCYGSSGITEVV